MELAKAAIRMESLKEQSERNSQISRQTRKSAIGYDPYYEPPKQKCAAIYNRNYLPEATSHNDVVSSQRLLDLQIETILNSQKQMRLPTPEILPSMLENIDSKNHIFDLGMSLL